MSALHLALAVLIGSTILAGVVITVTAVTAVRQAVRTWR